MNRGVAITYVNKISYRGDVTNSISSAIDIEIFRKRNKILANSTFFNRVVLRAKAAPGLQEDVASGCAADQYRVPGARNRNPMPARCLL